MLHHEQQVEKNRDIGQQELGRITSKPAPVFIEAGVDDQLGEREYATDEVEKDHFNPPVFGGLALEVEPGLGNVFDDGDEKFQVGDGVYLDLYKYFPCGIAHMYLILTHHVNPRPSARVIPSIRICPQDSTSHSTNQGQAAKKDAFHCLASLLMTGDREPPDLRPKLRIGYGGHEEGVHTESEVIEPHRGLFGQWMTVGILIANCGGEKKGTCVDGIADESQDINGEVVDGQTGCRSTPEIIDHLRIERCRPTERTTTIIRTLRATDRLRAVDLLDPSQKTSSPLVISSPFGISRIRSGNKP